MGHIDPTREVFAQFRANDRPGPIHMLNLVRLRAQAAYPDRRKATGAEAYAAYGRESGPVFERLGGRIVWQGRFELMLIGPEAERWEGRDFVEYLEQRRLNADWATNDAGPIGPLNRWRAAGPIAWRATKADDPEAIAAYLRSILPEAPLAMTKAVEAIEPDEARVVVRFRSSDPLVPKDVDGRIVECLLY